MRVSSYAISHPQQRDGAEFARCERRAKIRSRYKNDYLTRSCLAMAQVGLHRTDEERVFPVLADDVTYRPGLIRIPGLSSGTVTLKVLHLMKYGT